MLEIFNKAIEAAIQAGNEILKIYDQDFEVEFKADESPLTTADKAAHHLIIYALEKTPYPVLSEESAGITYEERKDWITYWLVDPLDGTKEFIKKNGEFTVNIALIDQGVPVFGVVYVPVLDTIYCGMVDAGCRTWDVECGMPAWKATECAGKSVSEIMQSAVPLSTSHLPRSTSHLPRSTSHQPLSTKQRAVRVVASKSHCNEETLQFIADLEKKYGATELVSRGSSLKLCMVAEGSADIYPRIAPTMEWDTAAAHAVVKAAGGEVFEYDAAVPADSYLCERLDVEGEMLDVGSEKLDVECAKSAPSFPLSPPTSHNHPPSSHVPRFTSHHPQSLHPLRYNKENLLNPYFVVV